MKKFYILILLAYCMQYTSAQNTFPSTGAAGVGTATPDASSLFEVKSTTKGLLIPRMTAAQRNAIVSPATGLLVYQTNATPGFIYYNGTAWKALAPAGVNKSLSNLTAPTAVNADLLPGIDNSLNLGSATNSWKDIYADGSIYLGGARFIAYKTGTGINNTAIGSGVLNVNTTGASNTGVGFNALNANTSGYSNVAIGTNTLRNNITGSNLVAVGDSALFNQTINANGWYYNTAVGSKALFANTTGAGNTALGNQALYLNAAGNDNTASGVAALYNNTTGSYNTAYGSHNLSSNNTGSFNTASGYTALYNNTSGNYNTANGYNALASNTTGFSNVALGVAALFKNTDGFNLIAIGDSALYNQAIDPKKIYSNTAIGSKALYANTTGNNNTGIGWGACYLNNGSDNTGIGNAALYKNADGYNNTAAGSHSMESNTSGYLNTAIGASSLVTNNTGIYNTAVGAYALRYNTTGVQNTAVGVGALADNTTGTENTAVGGYAMVNNTTGKNNTALGSQALNADSIGSSNTAIGAQAGLKLTKQSNNTIVGAFAGNEFTTSNATLIGYDADPNGAYSNISALGYQAMNTANNQVMLGNTSVTSVKAAGSYVIYSDGRYKKDVKNNVPGLAFITQLKPVTYHYDVQGMNKYMDIKEPDKKMLQQDEQAIADKERKLYTGFVAQDVEAVAKKLSYDFSGVYHPQNDKDLYGLSYADFVVPLVKAVQELSNMNDNKDAKIDSLQQQNKNQQKINADLQKQMNDLKNLVLQIQQTQQQCSPCSGSATANAIQQNNITLTNTAWLEQNVPNPFTNTTTIAYSLPSKFSSAKIIITDKNGKQLKQLMLSNAGKGTINVNASTLAAGAYNYSLYVDGRLIATKQMILTK